MALDHVLRRISINTAPYLNTTQTDIRSSPTKAPIIISPPQAIEPSPYDRTHTATSTKVASNYRYTIARSLYPPTVSNHPLLNPVINNRDSPAHATLPTPALPSIFTHRTSHPYPQNFPSQYMNMTIVITIPPRSTHPCPCTLKSAPNGSMRGQCGRRRYTWGDRGGYDTGGGGLIHLCAWRQPRCDRDECVCLMYLLGIAIV